MDAEKVEQGGQFLTAVFCLVAAAHAGDGDGLVLNGSMAVGIVGFQRSGEPVEEVLHLGRVAVVIFWCEDPQAVSLFHLLTYTGNGSRSREFYVFIDKWQVVKVKPFHLCLVFEQVVDVVGHLAVEGLLTQGSDDKEYLFHSRL